MNSNNSQSESPAQAPSSRGFYAMPRGWTESFRPPGLGEDASAYGWLVERAAYKPRIKRMQVNGKSRAIPLAIGDLCGGGRFLADQWGWNYPRARRHLAWLKRLGMISTRVEQGVSVITVCRYQDIQRGIWPFAKYGEDASHAPPHPAAEQPARSGAGSGASSTVVSICNRLQNPTGASKIGAGSDAGSGAPLTTPNQSNHEDDLHCSAASPSSKPLERGGEAAADPSVLPEPMLLRQRKLMPNVGDPPEKWFGVVTHQRGLSGGIEHPVCSGWLIDTVAARVRESSGIASTRLDLWTLAEWLRDGYTPDQIVEAIESQKRRLGKRYERPHSLSAFNSDVRALQPKPKAKSAPGPDLSRYPWLAELPRPIQYQNPMVMPRLNDPAELWIQDVTGASLPDEHGVERPVYMGVRVDLLAGRVHAASGMSDRVWGRDWWTILGWLRDGHTEDQIISAIEHHRTGLGACYKSPDWLSGLTDAVNAGTATAAA